MTFAGGINMGMDTNELDTRDDDKARTEGRLREIEEQEEEIDMVEYARECAAGVGKVKNGTDRT